MAFPIGLTWIMLGYYILGYAGEGLYLSSNIVLQICLMFVFLALSFHRIKKDSRPFNREHSSYGLQQFISAFDRTCKWLVYLILSLLAVRAIGVLSEVLLRPLFPWDAWRGYAIEAKVWFSFPDRFDAFTGPFFLADEIYWTGETTHPSGLGLIWLWFVQNIGDWNDSLMNAGWPIVWICTGLLLFGFSRLGKVRLTIALMTTYAFLSMPFVSTHAVLAGYADIWISVLFLVISGLIYLKYKWRQSASIFVPVIAGCLGMLMLKEHGILWVGVICLSMAISNIWLKIDRARVLLIVGVISVIVLLVYYYALGPSGQWLGNEGRLGIAGGVALVFPPSYESLFSILKHLYIYSNWHLFWYFFTVLYIAGLAISIFSYPDVAYFRVTMILSLSGAVFAGICVFTDFSQSVVDGTSVNRILLHITPTASFFCALTLEKLFQLSRCRGA
ncbi:hypothetical protein DZK25_05720 [Wenzhouxiangella sp. 15181]|nr:hypothetical protein DZK25_05720 [Wenzhouxiangella sp. 15181]